MVLTHHIESNLHLREGRAINNFAATLPEPESDLAKQLLRDPYNFDFLTLTQRHNERELEDSLIEHITKFLLELGAGFAYVGRQYKIEVDGDQYSIDLLFYHLRLHCYVVIDLKVVKFKPEFAGKLNFYVSAVDSQIRNEGDAATIGIRPREKHHRNNVDRRNNCYFLVTRLTFLALTWFGTNSVKTFKSIARRDLRPFRSFVFLFWHSFCFSWFSSNKPPSSQKPTDHDYNVRYRIRVECSFQY